MTTGVGARGKLKSCRAAPVERCGRDGSTRCSRGLAEFDEYAVRSGAPSKLEGPRYFGAAPLVVPGSGSLSSVQSRKAAARLLLCLVAIGFQNRLLALI